MTLNKIQNELIDITLFCPVTCLPASRSTWYSFTDLAEKLRLSHLMSLAGCFCICTPFVITTTITWSWSIQHSILILMKFALSMAVECVGRWKTHYGQTVPENIHEHSDDELQWAQHCKRETNCTTLRLHHFSICSYTRYVKKNAQPDRHPNESSRGLTKLLLSNTIPLLRTWASAGYSEEFLQPAVGWQKYFSVLLKNTQLNIK